MVWEIWGRHKVTFLWDGIALAASWLFLQWKEHGASPRLGEMLGFASLCCFLVAFGHLLVCFGHFEVDDGRVEIGFPARRLSKPVSTVRLVLVPMVFGAAVIVPIFAAWATLVWRRLIYFTASDLLWSSGVMLSFFWWMQALAWGLPLVKTRMPVVLAAGLIHFLAWRLPHLLTGALSGWAWPILTMLLLSAAPAAWIGLRLMRQGSWEGRSRLAWFWERRRFSPASSPSRMFGSAFGAQFWLEWRRQGWRLPGVSGAMAFLIVAIAAIPFVLFGKLSGGAGTDPETVLLLTQFMVPVLIMPLVLSILLAPALAKFDPLHSLGDLPVYIAVRPATNGDFVLAKVAMALATSVLTWLVTGAGLAGLLLLEHGTLISKAGLVTPFGPLSFTTGCVPGFLLLVLWTWKNLVAGIGAGLTGRAWVVGVSVYWRIALLIGMFALAEFCQANRDFREALTSWGTGILILCLAVKIGFSAIGFVWGVRRNALTTRGVYWLVGGWLVCGLLVAGYTGHVCKVINQPGLWFRLALAGFLVLPLADLAFAPLALAWNRHR